MSLLILLYIFSYFQYRNDTNPDEDNNSERRNSAGSDRNSEQRLTVSPNDLVKRVENLQ